MHGSVGKIDNKAVFVDRSIGSGFSHWVLLRIRAVKGNGCFWRPQIAILREGCPKTQALFPIRCSKSEKQMWTAYGLLKPQVCQCMNILDAYEWRGQHANKCVILLRVSGSCGL